MRVLDAECKNFRNIEVLNSGNFDEMNVICGENAQGKTNLLEAIWLFTAIKSLRGSKDCDFIRFGENAAVLNLNFEAQGINEEARLEIK